MNHDHDLMVLATAVASTFRGIQAADRDDIRQEVALGMMTRAGNLNTNRSVKEQAGYLFHVGKSCALDYLRWRAKSAREIPSSQPAHDHSHVTKLEMAQGREHDGDSPEDVATASDSQARAARVIQDGIAVLSSQQAALLRHKLGLEPMREDLVRLGKGPRGAVSNVARRKLLEVARAQGADDIVTPEFLLRLFGVQRG